MRRKIILLIGVVLVSAFAKAQIITSDYRIDSLQFKMYTRIYVNERLQLDSVTVRKIFCDWCTDSQIDILHQEAMRQSMIERYNPRYKKPGEHRLALFVRFSKEDFKKLDSLDGY